MSCAMSTVWTGDVQWSSGSGGIGWSEALR